MKIINKIERYKNDILKLFYEAKTQINPLGPTTEDGIREKCHLNYMEYEEIKRQLIDDGFFILNISDFPLDKRIVFISMKGELFIKSGGYCLKNKLKNFLGKGSLVIIGALISGFFTILGIILGYLLTKVN